MTYLKFIDNIKNIAKNGKMDLQTAIETARDKLKGQAQMVAIAGLFVFSSFIITAIIAPFAFKAKGMISSFLSFLPIIILSIGVYFGFKGIFSISKNENKISKTQYKGTLAKTAIEIAIKEAKDAGLINENQNDFSDSISGIANSFPIVSFRMENFGCCVIRLKKDFNSILVISPKNSLWPVKLPTNRKLTPIVPNEKLPIEAWGLAGEKSREQAQSLLNEISPIINMSLMGGELPFIYAENKSFLIGFKTGDIGTISLIGNEATKLLRENFGM